MAKKDFTMTSKILMSLLAVGDAVLVTPYEMRQRMHAGNIVGDFRKATALSYYLAKKGLIRYVDKNNERFVRLTKKGQLEALLAKARLPGTSGKWDGKWRLIMFDIPEESNDKRAFFRSLLKKNQFVRLQQSVYVSPYPLNRDAISYLQETKLIGYIRVLKVEEMDNDKVLRKHFGLN